LHLKCDKKPLPYLIAVATRTELLSRLGFKNRLNVSGAVQNANYLQWFSLGTIDDQIGINRPESKRFICQIVAGVAHAGHIGQLPHRSPKRFPNLLCSLWTALLSNVYGKLGQIGFGYRGQYESSHVASLGVGGSVWGAEDFVKRSFSVDQLPAPGLIQADGDPGSDVCQVSLAFLQKF
jgi:hypothetical protein